MNVLIRKISSLSSITPHIKDFTKHNLQFIDKIEITIYNPNTVSSNSIFRNYQFNANISFLKNDMRLYKQFENNDFEILLNNIKKFINNEIKI